MKLINVTKTYPIKDNNPVEALKNMSVELPNKGMVFFVGKSGSGKSTLLNLLGGLDRPTSGTIDINGIQMNSFSNHDLDIHRLYHVGFIFQDLNLIENLSIRDNISISLELSGITCDSKMIEEALSVVDLEGYSNRMPNTLSGGQRQRVAIARALIKSPDIILADEPTGSLDSETSKQIFELLRKLSQSNLVIVVSHDLDYANQYGDRIIELKDGRILKDSNPIQNHGDLNPANDTKDIKPSQTHSLPSKRAVQLAYHYLKLKKWKFILSLTISLLTFLLFGLFDSLGSFDVAKNSIESIYETNQTNVLINQIYKEKSQYYHKIMNLSFDDVDSFKSKYPNSTFIPVMTEFNLNYSNLLYNGSDIDENLYVRNSMGGISVTEEILDDLGFELSFGNMPTGKDQVLVSLQTFNMFKDYDYRTKDNQKVEIESLEDIIGLYLYDDTIPYEIVGVVNTHIDLSKFEKMFNGSEQNMLERISYDYEYEGIMNSGIHQAIFMYHDVINEYEDTYSSSFKLVLAEVPSTTTFDTFDGSISSYDMLDSFAQITETKRPNSIIWIDEEHQVLSENQVLLPHYAITNNSNSRQEVYEMIDRLVDLFVNEHYSEIQTEYEANETKPYSDFIKLTDSNPYHPGYTISYFYHEALKEWNHSHYDDFIAGQMEITGELDQVYDIEVVGFYTDFIPSGGLPAYFSDSLYNTVIQTHNFYPLYGMIVSLSGNKKEDMQLISEITQNKAGLSFLGTNPIVTSAKRFDEEFDDLSTILLYVGALLALISTMQLFNLITTSISMKKKEIGILRALGARIKDVMKIFYSEALLIGLISAISAIVVNVIINFSANHYFEANFGLSYDLLIFGYRQVLIIFGFVLVASTLSSIIPVYIYSRKNPIETIRLF